VTGTSPPPDRGSDTELVEAFLTAVAARSLTVAVEEITLP
jgi:hypothetical protein